MWAEINQSKATHANPTGGPLAGVRVLDFTTTFLGPYATMLMSQMGAEVIKVESHQGDVVRGVGAARNPGMSATFLTINTGKRSIVVDLKKPESAPVLERLVQETDVVIHNMRSHTAETLGLTYERLTAINPRVIFAEAYGFSASSPDAGRPAYDDVIQAASGIADLESRRHGRPEYVSTIMADKIGALVALYAVLAALYERESTGRGQSVVVPMQDSLITFLLPEQLAGKTFEPPIGPAVYPRTTSKYRRPYETKDGYIGAVLYTDRHWRSFIEAIGQGEMLNGPMFADISSRTRNIDKLYEFLESILRTETSEYWMKLFRELDCPAAELRTLDDLIDDSHLRESGTIGEYDHPTEGRLRCLGLPAQFSEHTIDPVGGRAAPRLGEHTTEVLAELGLSADEIASLSQDGVVWNAAETPRARS